MFTVFPRGERRYIEASKTRIGSFAAAAAEGDQEAEAEAEARARSSRRTLVYVFDTCLRLLHPFMPFITEALWQQLPRKGDALMVAPWPKVDDTPLAVDQSAIDRWVRGVHIGGGGDGLTIGADVLKWSGGVM